MAETVIYFVRHAQSHPKVELTEPEWPLSDKGIQQAAAIAPIIEELGIDEVYTSPYSRCVATIKPYCEAAGKEFRLNPELRERRISAGWIDDFTEVWRKSWEDYSYALPNAESSAACQKRMFAAVTDIADRHAGKTLALSSHGNAISLFLNAVDPRFAFAQASAMRNPDIFRVVRAADGFRLDREFRTGTAFDRIATGVHETPGIKT
ncbi:MAG: histidine phosphatase family protein [Elusimicrobiota bacterium]